MSKVSHERRNARDLAREGDAAEYERLRIERRAIRGHRGMTWVNPKHAETRLAHYDPQVFDKGVDALKSRRLRSVQPDSDTGD